MTEHQLVYERRQRWDQLGRWYVGRDLVIFAGLRKDPDPVFPPGRCTQNLSTGLSGFAPFFSSYKLLHPSITDTSLFFLDLGIQIALS